VLALSITPPPNPVPVLERISPSSTFAGSSELLLHHQWSWLYQRISYSLGRVSSLDYFCKLWSADCQDQSATIYVFRQLQCHS
jgi:hypothetical protein